MAPKGKAKGRKKGGGVLTSRPGSDPPSPQKSRKNGPILASAPPSPPKSHRNAAASASAPSSPPKSRTKSGGSSAIEKPPPPKPVRYRLLTFLSLVKVQEVQADLDVMGFSTLVEKPWKIRQVVILQEYVDWKGGRNPRGRMSKVKATDDTVQKIYALPRGGVSIINVKSNNCVDLFEKLEGREYYDFHECKDTEFWKIMKVLTPYLYPDKGNKVRKHLAHSFYLEWIYWPANRHSPHYKSPIDWNRFYAHKLGSLSDAARPRSKSYFGPVLVHCLDMENKLTKEEADYETQQVATDMALSGKVVEDSGDSSGGEEEKSEVQSEAALPKGDGPDDTAMQEVDIPVSRDVDKGKGIDPRKGPGSMKGAKRYFGMLPRESTEVDLPQDAFCTKWPFHDSAVFQQVQVQCNIMSWKEMHLRRAFLNKKYTIFSEYYKRIVEQLATILEVGEEYVAKEIQEIKERDKLAAYERTRIENMVCKLENDVDSSQKDLDKLIAERKEHVKKTRVATINLENQLKESKVIGQTLQNKVQLLEEERDSLLTSFVVQLQSCARNLQDFVHDYLVGLSVSTIKDKSDPVKQKAITAQLAKFRFMLKEYIKVGEKITKRLEGIAVDVTNQQSAIRNGSTPSSSLGKREQLEFERTSGEDLVHIQVTDLGDRLANATVGAPDTEIRPEGSLCCRGEEQGGKKQRLYPEISNLPSETVLKRGTDTRISPVWANSVVGEKVTRELTRGGSLHGSGSGDFPIVIASKGLVIADRGNCIISEEKVIVEIPRTSSSSPGTQDMVDGTPALTMVPRLQDVEGSSPCIVTAKQTTVGPTDGTAIASMPPSSNNSSSSFVSFETAPLEEDTSNTVIPPGGIVIVLAGSQILPGNAGDGINLTISIVAQPDVALSDSNRIMKVEGENASS